jgi:hypothetical protein
MAEILDESKSEPVVDTIDYRRNRASRFIRGHGLTQAKNKIENNRLVPFKRIADYMSEHASFADGLGIGLFASGVVLTYVGVIDCAILSHNQLATEIEVSAGLTISAIGLTFNALAASGRPSLPVNQTEISSSEEVTMQELDEGPLETQE